MSVDKFVKSLFSLARELRLDGDDELAWKLEEAGVHIERLQKEVRLLEDAYEKAVHALREQVVDTLGSDN